MAADLVIRGGRVFSVFTREWLDGDLAIADGYVAGLGAVGADGCVPVPGGPGLGVAYDRDFITRHSQGKVTLEAGE